MDFSFGKLKKERKKKSLNFAFAATKVQEIIIVTHPVI